MEGNARKNNLISPSRDTFVVPGGGHIRYFGWPGTEELQVFNQEENWWGK